MSHRPAHATTHISTGADAIPAAVAAGASGLMTGADKTKLDSVSSGAGVGAVYIDTTANVLATTPTVAAVGYTTEATGLQYTYKVSEAAWVPRVAGLPGKLCLVASGYTKIGAGPALGDNVSGVAGSGLVLDPQGGAMTCYRSPTTFGSTWYIEAPIYPAWGSAGWGSGGGATNIAASTAANFGIAACDGAVGANGNLVRFFIDGLGTAQLTKLSIQRFTNITTFAATLIGPATVTNQIPPNGPIWLKIERDATNTTFSYAGPSRVYEPIYQIANASLDLLIVPTRGALMDEGGSALITSSKALIPSFYAA